MTEVFQATSLDSIDQLAVVEPEPRTGNEWLVEQQLAELLGSNLKLRLVYWDRYMRENAANILVLEFKIIDIQVSYRPESEGRFTRLIQAVWFMKLQTAAGVVLFLDTVTKSHEDQITRHDVAKVENSNLTITQGHWPDAGTFAKYIEPIVVTIVSGLIIYLFFIMRSN